MKPSDYYFAVHKDGTFWLTSKEYWNKEGVLDDCLSDIECLPFGFANLMEANWEYYSAKFTLDTKAGIQKLLEAGFERSEEMEKFVNSF